MRGDSKGVLRNAPISLAVSRPIPALGRICFGRVAGVRGGNRIFHVCRSALFHHQLSNMRFCMLRGGKEVFFRRETKKILQAPFKFCIVSYLFKKVYFLHFVGCSLYRQADDEERNDII